MPAQIKVQEVDVKAERRRKRLKVGGAVLASAVLLGTGIGAAWYFTPPAMPTTIDEARAMVNSPRFERLSKQQKQPYYDVIREQYGSLDRDARRAMRDEDEKLRETMREARTIQMREMMVEAARGDGEMQMPFGPPRGDRPRGDQPGPGGPPGGGDGGGGGDQPRAERPEPTDEQRAERAERMRDHISDRMANGDAQLNQLMREMFSQRREQRD